MVKNKRIIWGLTAVFLLTEATLGLLFQVSSHYFGYALVILAAVFCAVFHSDTKEYKFTQSALIFTVISDFFLLILDDYYSVGMVFFLIAQSFYAMRVFSEMGRGKILKIHLTVRAIISITALILPFLILGGSVDFLSVISLLYYATLIVSTAFAFIGIKSKPKMRILAAGLLLFCFCDIFVGLSNLSSYFEIEKSSVIYKLISGDVNMAWVFYTPSQALLAISLIEYKKTDR